MPNISNNNSPATIELDSDSVSALAKRIALTSIQTSLDDIMSTRERLIFMASAIKALKEKMDAALIEWLEANGEIRIGSRKIFVGHKKDTKCKSLRPALEALMNECGGDWELFCSCMASDAIKHGAAKSVMGEKWSEHFEVRHKPEIKEVVDVDEKFLKPKGKH